MNKREKLKQFLLEECAINVRDYANLSDKEILDNLIPEIPEASDIHWYQIKIDSSEALTVKPRFSFIKYVGISSSKKERPLKFEYAINSDEDFEDGKELIKKLFEIFEEELPTDFDKQMTDLEKPTFCYDKDLRSENDEYCLGIHWETNKIVLGYQ